MSATFNWWEKATPLEASPALAAPSFLATPLQLASPLLLPYLDVPTAMALALACGPSSACACALLGAPAAPLRGWKRQAARLLALVLDVDRLFDGNPGGIGWLLVARKRPLDSF